MSITSLISTLAATSIVGFPPLLVNLEDTVMALVLGEDASEQTAAITSHTSAGFNRKCCCSLFQIARFQLQFDTHKLQYTHMAKQPRPVEHKVSND